MRSGTSHSITIRLPGRGIIQIGDGWWTKNPDFWTGWLVTLDNTDGIAVRSWPRTKKRAEVVAAVREADVHGVGMTNDPAKGDTIRWTQSVNDRRRQFTGKVETVHADRWLVKVGPGRMFDLARPVWEATGEVVVAAKRVQLRLVTA